jgi:hypothetical protein
MNESETTKKQAPMNGKKPSNAFEVSQRSNEVQSVREIMSA